jgi:spermidine/putrescine transport system permease protein
MNDDAVGVAQLAQLKITPRMGPATEEPAESPAQPAPGGGGMSVAPLLPGEVSPTAPVAPAPVTVPTGPAGTSLNITIANPDQLPSLPPGEHELKLVIGDADVTAGDAEPPAGGLGFFEVFVALVLALVVAPYVQKQAGRWVANVNAIDFVRKNGFVITVYLVGFSFGWIIFLIILPQIYMLDFSFRFNLTPAEIGGSRDVYTLKNYEYLLLGRPGDEELLNWLHLEVFFKTIVASVLVTLINFLMCYPLAYYMAQSVKGGNQRLLFLCLLLPFWVNEILRAFAFKLIFAQVGILNEVLIAVGIWDTPFDFFKADIALFTGLTYAYILLMIFPLYNAIESLDHNQVEAARDLGSSWLRIHLRVVMPHAKPGIASGCTMVFMLAAGALAAPNILGGPSSLWFTQIIYQWYNTGGNWPQGSAYAFVLLIACIIFVRIVMRIFKVSLGDIAQR